jgi:hypothetical protein
LVLYVLNLNVCLDLTSRAISVFGLLLPLFLAIMLRLNSEIIAYPLRYSV